MRLAIGYHGILSSLDVVQSAYPERGWLLANHMTNVLHTQPLVNNAATIEYGMAFRKCTSHSSRARWEFESINYGWS